MSRRLMTPLAVLAGLLPVAGAAQAKPSIAVLGLEAVAGGGGVDEEATRAAAWLTAGLRQRAAIPTGPYTLAPNSDKDLVEMKLLSDCYGEGRECMAGIGRELGAERLLYGKVERRGGSYHVTLNLLHVAGAAMERTATEVIPAGDADEAGLRGRARSFYNRLTGMTDDGVVVVRADVATGTVYIDGEVRGQLDGGRARIEGVAVGSHSVGLASDGYHGWEGRVTVGAGDTIEVAATLQPADDGLGRGRGGDRVGSSGRPGGTSRALFWTSLVATGAGVTAFTITGLQVRGSLEDAKLEAIRELEQQEGIRLDQDNACADAKDNHPTSMGAQAVVSACDKGRSRATLTNVFIGASVVTALAAGYFYYQGYVAPGPARTEKGHAARQRSRSRAPLVRVTPSLSPSAIGAGLEIEF